MIYVNVDVTSNEVSEFNGLKFKISKKYYFGEFNTIQEARAAVDSAVKANSNIVCADFEDEKYNGEKYELKQGETNDETN